MSRSKQSRELEVVLSSGQAVYEQVCELEPGPYGERVVLASRRVPRGSAQRVVLKVLSLKGEGGARAPVPERARRRLEEEVRLAGYLRHPGIARVHGLHETADALYVELEHVPGPSLDEAVTLGLERGRLYSESFVLYVGAQVAAALAYAHGLEDERGHPLGLIHRDVHPQRIRVGPQGEVKLTDFGLAWSQLPGRLASSVTRPHGKAFFAAPEVLFGEAVDARADLFSLGLVLLELGTGLHLYSLPEVREAELEARLTEEDEARVARAGMLALEAGLAFDDYEHTALFAAAFQPADVEALTVRLSPPLRSILHRLLRRRPDERFATAGELDAELRARLEALGPYDGEAAAAELALARAQAGAQLVEAELTPCFTLRPRVSVP